MSPVSRSRKKKQNRARDARRAGHEASPFAPILKQAHLVHQADSSVEAELWAAAIVGGIDLMAQREGADDLDDVLEAFLTGLIGYLSSRETPDALAALRAFSLVGEDWARELASEAAAQLSSRGIDEPRWFAGSEPLEPLDAWQVGDPFGESEVIMVGFRRPEGDHALFALVDRVTDQGLVQLELLDVGPGGVRELIEAYRNIEGLTEPVQLPLTLARARLEPALETYVNFAPLPNEDEEENEADPSNTWPVLIPRLDLLPEGTEDEPEEVDEAQLAAVVDSFLASPHAAALPDRNFARSWAFSAVDWAVEHGWESTWFGPLAVSDLLMEQAGEHVSVEDSQMAALEASVVAWARFTADVRELPADTRRLWDEVLPVIWEDFQRAYHDPDVVEHRATCEEVLPLGDYVMTRVTQAHLRAALAHLHDPETSPFGQ